MLVAVFVSGCGKQNESNEPENMEVAYEINGALIIPGSNFSEAYARLGEPVKYTEGASCYFDGMDKVYTYDGFEVRTYPGTGGDYVQDLCISSDGYATDRGITVGSSVQDVLKAYGEDYKLNGKMYRYYSDDDMYCYFFIMNDVVKYFGYAADIQN